MFNFVKVIIKYTNMCYFNEICHLTSIIVNNYIDFNLFILLCMLMFKKINYLYSVCYKSIIKLKVYNKSIIKLYFYNTFIT